MLVRCGKTGPSRRRSDPATRCKSLRLDHTLDRGWTLVAWAGWHCFIVRSQSADALLGLPWDKQCIVRQSLEERFISTPGGRANSFAEEVTAVLSLGGTHVNEWVMVNQAPLSTNSIPHRACLDGFGPVHYSGQWTLVVVQRPASTEMNSVGLWLRGGLSISLSDSNNSIPVELGGVALLPRGKSKCRCTAWTALGQAVHREIKL